MSITTSVLADRRSTAGDVRVEAVQLHHEAPLTQVVGNDQVTRIDDGPVFRRTELRCATIWLSSIVFEGMTFPTPEFTAPTWPHCDNPAGCPGIRVGTQTQCLAHLASTDRAAYLAGLNAGDTVDHRGTTFSHELLSELFDAVYDPAINAPRFGTARFTGACFQDGLAEATFDDVATFNEATFTGLVAVDKLVFRGPAIFDRAKFDGLTTFHQVTFDGEASFVESKFLDHVSFVGLSASKLRFTGSTFSSTADFSGATVSAVSFFDRVTFAEHAGFERITFHSDVSFIGTSFAVMPDFTDTAFGNASHPADARFDGARFSHSGLLGPISCSGCLNLSGAEFAGAVTVEVAASSLVCTHTRWESTATMHVRYAYVDLSDAVVTQPLAITAHPVPFRTGSSSALLAEAAFTGEPVVRVTSLRGVDAMHVVLTDTDLSSCVFTGAFHLDQLRIEGDAVFASPPRGWRLRSGVPARLARRRTVAEEHHWRALAADNPPPPRGWNPGPNHPEAALTPGPHDVAPVYRALRKAAEDAKNEPDAADFYYGEMEMRRHDRKRPAGERALITGYWLVSGYGLRASRALGWLLGLMTTTVLAMMLWGLPTSAPQPQVIGKQSAPGQDVRLTVDNPAPEISGGVHDRLSARRAEKSASIVLNSVLFRSSGQNLTTVGTYIEMAARFTEPVLLGLAVLAIRGRVKR